MNKIWTAGLLALGLVVAPTLATVGGAATSNGAEVTPPPYGAECLPVTVTPTNPVTPGAYLRISGSNVVKGTKVLAEIGSDYEDARADRRGNFKLSLKAPKTAGEYILYVTARCATPTPLTVTKEITVIVQAPAPPQVPGAPTNVDATRSKDKVTVTWTAASNNPTLYTVKYQVNGTGSYKTLGTSTTTTLTKKIPVKRWNTLSFVVYASNAGGTGPASAPPFVLEKNPTLPPPT